MAGPSRLAARFYRLLLWIYPAEFRREHGADASRTFAELHDDTIGVVAVTRLWMRALKDVLGGGLRERLASSPRPVGSPASASSSWRVSEIWRDASMAARLVRRQPGFALTTVLLVALGVGSTATMFSVVNTVLLKPLPYPQADRLVTLLKGNSELPIPDFLDLRARALSFEAYGATWPQPLDLSGSGDPEQLAGALVLDDLFGVLGARAWRGRLFEPRDFAAGAPRVAVISAGLWQRRWVNDPAVVGHTIRLDGAPATIVGILRPDFIRPEAVDLEKTEVFVPLDVSTSAAATDRHTFVLEPVARLAPGVTPAAARAELAAIATALAAQYPDAWRTRDGKPQQIGLRTMLDATVGDAGAALWPFLGAVALMLLIGCANIANLFLARAHDRRHEIALRSALGAGRARILRQLLTESLLLALVGGSLGVPLAWGGLRAFAALAPSGIPRLAELHMDVPVLIFAIALSVTTGLLFGLAPALSAAKASGASTRQVTATGLRLRNSLVVVELALALVLMTGSGLLFGSFIRLRRVDPGFDVRNLLTIQLDTSARVRPDAHGAFVQELLRRLSAIPGVEAVGASWRLPFAGGGRCCWSLPMTSDGVPGEQVHAILHPITADYFRVLGVSIAEGRSLDAHDFGTAAMPGPGASSPAPSRLPVVVSRAVANQLWPGQSGLGRVMRGIRNKDTGYEVVGVINGIRHWRLDTGNGQDIYLPFSVVSRWDMGRLDVAIRYAGSDDRLAGAARAIVTGLDPDLPLSGVATMEERVSGSIATPRFYAALLMTFGTLAFVLAAAGVYGSMLYVVGLRRREMSIRLALGASSADLMKHIVGRGAWLVLAGAVAGLTSAIGLSRVLKSLLFDVSPTDPATLGAAVLALSAVGLLACWGPARRAAQADPAATLRA